MAKIDYELFLDKSLGRFRAFGASQQARLEAAMLITADKASRKVLADFRSKMQGAGLGRLGNALDQTSDLAKRKGVHRRAGGGISASGIVFIRSQSQRTRGTIEAYTQGAQISPRKGRWLWIPSKQIARIGAGKKRLTPGTWKASGMDAKVGPLVFVRRPNGYPLLIVSGVGFGATGRAGSKTKRGGLKKSQVTEGSIVAFIGIPHTARAARVRVRDVVKPVVSQVPQMLAAELGRI